MKTKVLLFLLAIAALGVPARAVDRLAAIAAPGEVAPGGEARVVLMASTDAKDGEKIGFVHSEYSTDGGKTWRNLCYLENADASIERSSVIVGGPAGTMIVVRLRVAFRGGRSGDVDFRGRPIDWDGAWAEWRSPPARIAIIYVR
jgi:hypothetical protein